MKTFGLFLLTLFFINGCESIEEVSGVEPTFKALDSVSFEVNSERPDWLSPEFILELDDDSSEPEVTIVKDEVDFKKVGEYEVILMAKDSDGFEVTEVITVTITDSIPPFISDRPSFPDILIVGDPMPLWDEHISIIDVYDGRISVTEDMVETDLDLSEPGTYKLSVTVVDSSNNQSSQEYIVRVVYPYIVKLDDFEYFEREDGYVLFEYTNKREKRIEIPSSFDGIPVVSIYNNAFRSQGIFRLILNEGLLEIGSNAFSSNKLEYLQVPSTVKSIGREAFAQNSIKSLDMSPTVKVESEAFNDNEIERINGIESNGIIFGFGETFDLTRIVSYGGTSEIVDFIPETVKWIDDGAFMQSDIEEVIIPENVEYIGEYAFAFNELVKVSLPEKVELGVAVFIGNSMEYLNGEEFNGIIFDRTPSGEIDYKTINSYGGVARDVNFIPEDVESINPGAFQTARLQSIIIPASVQEVGAYALAYNSSLERVVVQGENPMRLAYGLTGYGIESLLNFPIEDIEDEGNTLVVFVTFSNYADFVPSLSFNELHELFKGSISLEKYIEEVSYGQYKLSTQFLGDDYNFYVDPNPMEYYLRKSEQNPIGYETLSEETYRLNELFTGMGQWIDDNNFIDDGTMLDKNNDGAIDNLILYHLGEGGWADILWPKQGTYFGPNVSIAGKEIKEMSMLSLGNPGEDNPSTLSVYAHEFLHLLGAADYYQYGEPFESSLRSWDIMASGRYLIHPTQFVKERHLGFEIDKLVVEESGTYTINNTLNDSSNAIHIVLKKAYEDIYIEYRTTSSSYEVDLFDYGVIVYRVNERYNGNQNGVYNDQLVGIEEIHVYRPTEYLEEYVEVGKYVLKPIEEYVNGPFAYNSTNAAMNLETYQEMGTGTPVKVYYSNGVEIPIKIELVEMDEDSATLRIQFTGEQ